MVVCRPRNQEVWGSGPSWTMDIFYNIYTNYNIFLNSLIDLKNNNFFHVKLHNEGGAVAV